jgi:hypothetical protein
LSVERFFKWRSPTRDDRSPYILAAGSRGAVTVGTPRDWKASVSYKF